MRSSGWRALKAVACGADVAAAEGGGRGDDEMAAHRIAAGADRTLDLVELAQQAAALVENCSPSSVSVSPRVEAVHELDAEAFLERVEPPPHHHRGDAFDQRRSREAALLGDQDEAAQCGMAIHSRFSNSGLEHTLEDIPDADKAYNGRQMGELRRLHPGNFIRYFKSSERTATPFIVPHPVRMLRPSIDDIHPRRQKWPA